eukprot:3368979-Pleurochrysis_carterae.AAC.3
MSHPAGASSPRTRARSSTAISCIVFNQVIIPPGPDGRPRVDLVKIKSSNQYRSAQAIVVPKSTASTTASDRERPWSG